MINKIEELKKFLKELKEEEITFKPYFYEKIKDRPYLNEKSIIDNLKNTENLLGFQKQKIKDKERYRVGIRLSNCYTLVVIAEIEEKGLNIITAWKTSRKWQKAIQK